MSGPALDIYNFPSLSHSGQVQGEYVGGGGHPPQLISRPEGLRHPGEKLGQEGGSEQDKPEVHAREKEEPYLGL